MVSETGAEFVVKISEFCELSSQEAPTDNFKLSGVLIQEDPDEPYTSGYKLLPLVEEDLEILSTPTVEPLPHTISIYPNPFTSVLNITTKEDLLYTIRDLKGKVVYSSSQLQKSIDVSYLESGVYLLQLSNGYTKRIVKL